MFVGLHRQDSCSSGHVLGCVAFLAQEKSSSSGIAHAVELTFIGHRFPVDVNLLTVPMEKPKATC